LYSQPHSSKSEKTKAIPGQAYSDPERSRRLRLPDCNRHTKVASLSAPAAFTPRKYSWYLLLLEAESIRGPKCGRKDYVNENFQLHLRNRTRNLGACSAVPQPSASPLASPNIIRFAKLRKNFGRTCSIHGEIIYGNFCLSEILRKRDPSGHSYNWRIILKCV